MFPRQSNLVLAVVCLTLGTAAGRLSQPLAPLIADEKKPPEAFLSGGARSEKVLQEIHATLKQLDGRVARIEDSVVRAGNPAAPPGIRR